jgi:hypothetical protein
MVAAAAACSTNAVGQLHVPGPDQGAWSRCGNFGNKMPASDRAMGVRQSTVSQKITADDAWLMCDPEQEAAAAAGEVSASSRLPPPAGKKKNLSTA